MQLASLVVGTSWAGDLHCRADNNITWLFFLPLGLGVGVFFSSSPSWGRGSGLGGLLDQVQESMLGMLRL